MTVAVEAVVEEGATVTGDIGDVTLAKGRTPEVAHLVNLHPNFEAAWGAVGVLRLPDKQLHVDVQHENPEMACLRLDALSEVLRFRRIANTSFRCEC